jgi:hypothetical protein
MTMAITRTKCLPSFSVFLGLLCFAAFAIGGETGEGVWALGVMTAAGLFFLLAGRSEIVRGLRGDGRDEYWERLDFRAAAFSGLAAIAAIIGMCLWEWAHGRDGSPYAQLGAARRRVVPGPLGVLRWRS